MSGKVSGWVWDQELPVHLKYILLAYADHADHEGYNVFPSIALIAKKAGLDRRTIQRSTRELEQLGFLIDDGHGTRGTNRWRIPLEGAAPMPPLEEEGAAPADMGGGAGDQGGGVDGAEEAAPIPPEPSLEPSEETSMNRAQISKNDQTPLVLAKAAILTDLNNGNMYARKPEIFELVFEPLRSLEAVRVAGLGSHPIWRINLEHPNPDVFDDRLEAMLEQKLCGVLGGAVDMQISRMKDE